MCIGDNGAVGRTLTRKDVYGGVLVERFTIRCQRWDRDY